MKPSLFSTTFLAGSSLIALALTGCPTTPATDAGTDAGPAGDAPVMAMCPRTMVPNAEEQMLPCCYRVSQATNTASPELRLRYIDITQPAASPLAGDTVGDLLNTSLRQEQFNWLFRVEGADADGPITITTGFGRRDAADGTYAFSSGMAPDMPQWAPVALDGTLTGESLTTDPFVGGLTVPIFDEAMTTVQIELNLQAIRVLESTFTEERSCVGSLRTALSFNTGATLGGFVTVESARAGMIMFPGIETSLCGVIAGDLLNPTYCDDNAQSAWTVQPDSRCEGSDCVRNGMGGTCDPTGVDTATACNAWYLEADFAAVGVNID